MSNSSTVLVPGQQLVVTIPHNIPAPKFHLFQRVRSHGGRTGVIVGMSYTTFVAAMKADIEMGWEYTIDRVYGIPEKQALNVSEPQEYCLEDSLEAVEDSTDA